MSRPFFLSALGFQGFLMRYYKVGGVRSAVDQVRSVILNTYSNYCGSNTTRFLQLLSEMCEEQNISGPLIATNFNLLEQTLPHLVPFSL